MKRAPGCTSTHIAEEQRHEQRGRSQSRVSQTEPPGGGVVVARLSGNTNTAATAAAAAVVAIASSVH